MCAEASRLELGNTRRLDGALARTILTAPADTVSLRLFVRISIDLPVVAETLGAAVATDFATHVHRVLVERIGYMPNFSDVVLTVFSHRQPTGPWSKAREGLRANDIMAASAALALLSTG